MVICSVQSVFIRSVLLLEDKLSIDIWSQNAILKIYMLKLITGLCEPLLSLNYNFVGYLRLYAFSELVREGVIGHLWHHNKY